MSEPSEFEKAEILESTRRQVESEHEIMRQEGCPRCGSPDVVFFSQTRNLGEDRDRLVYECRRCKHRFERVFQLPIVPEEEYDVLELVGAKKDT